MSDSLAQDFLQSCQGRTVWVLAPHPDDEVFGCGGTLALLAANQAQVVVDIVSDGAFGEFGKNPQARVNESRAAAAVLGYDAPNLFNFPDQGLRFGQGLIDHFLARVQALQPHVVFIPSVWEIHPDHLAVCAAAREAIRLSGLAVEVWMYEVGQALRPNAYIDISAVFEQKQRAMACFASQLRVQAYDRHISALNTYRTYQLPASIVAAEAFHRLDPLLVAAGGSALGAALAPVALQRAERPQPLVSVLVRSSNRSELMQALRSVGEQTYPNIEICVVNATGQAHAPLPDFIGTRPLRLLDAGRPLGRSEAANTLLEQARGDFALFLDDDDWLMPSHIAGLAQALQEDPAVLAVYGDTICVEQDREGHWHEVRRFEGDIQIGALPFDNKLPIHAVLFRRSAVAHLRFDQAFDLFEDWDWWLQLTQHGAFVHVPGASAIYRIHAAGGLGVRADATKARAALEQIVHKWHQGLPIEQAVNRLAYTRGLLQALLDEQQRSTALRCELDEAKRNAERLVQGYETALAEQNTVRQLQVEGDAALHERHALQQVMQQLATMHEDIHDIRRTSAWSVVGMLRRLKRRLLQPQHPAQLPKGTVERTSTESLMTQFKRRVKNSAVLRQIYYHLPLDAGQRFRLRAWLGRLLAMPTPSSAVSPLAFDTNDKKGQGTATGSVPVLSIGRPALLAGAASLAAKQPPVVSVIIPCFNQGQFLHDSIGSTLAAYQGPLDIVVVDDGSTDPVTLRCLGDIQRIHPGVRIIRQENGGLSAARNTGLEQACGDYIQFLDADDLLVPGKLDAQVQQMQTSPCDVALCNYLVSNHELTEYARHEETIQIGMPLDLETFLFKWERGLTIPIHCALFSKRVLQNTRFLTTLKAKEDWVFWCELASKQAVFTYVDFNGVIYRMHQGSMRRSFVSMSRQWLQAVAYIDRLYGQQYLGFFDASVSWLQQYYTSHPHYQEEVKQYRGH
ncbi:MAG: glycosyltransferase [Brachymonas sp.]|nr:glycosyltransferase [Brachymonas sp.]